MSKIFVKSEQRSLSQIGIDGGTIALTSEIPTKASWNYDDIYSKLGHTHDDRYYTESEINSKLGAYLPLSGGTMTGTINANDNA